ncbi:efflux RND transporter periplasmic adaptor subunit [Legionella gresilensis]|uniref:efflux RND transporter periplasmic adaptor subunit n=1 Tax=Legionella gresilensis TaxID=91823 RepID=UPI001040EAA2|nr:efflux RND transporter periplasmic adaptor subunit [Legionella gresilensis]
MKSLKTYLFYFQLLIFLLSFILLSFKPISTYANNENNLTSVIEKGPHGGRLFKADNITLELFIFERNMPPHFRAYLYEKEKIVNPNQAHLTLQLMRFTHKKEMINFIPIEDFLQSNQVIEEPHSFDVDIKLTLDKKLFNWHYSSYEGRVKIVPAMLQAANMQIAVAQSQIIKKSLKVVGKITPNRNTLAPIYARYSGIIQSMTKNLGDEVKQGEVLAIIESSESLEKYTITSPITGTIVRKQATKGELAQNTKPIYEVANLTTVWADFTLYRKDAPLVKQGMVVTVTGDDGKPMSTSTISYISPLGIEDSQTILARAVLANEKRLWLPGMYINGIITIKVKRVPIAILLSALQLINNKEVVFLKQGNYFEATPVILGEKDEQWAEVISGLDAGQQYVSKNSFFIKAELGKEGASHDH